MSNDISTCNQQGCHNEAAYRFTWAGQNEAGICEKHAAQIKAVASAIGYHLQLIPLESKLGREIKP